MNETKDAAMDRKQRREHDEEMKYSSASRQIQMGEEGMSSPSQMNVQYHIYHLPREVIAASTIQMNASNIILF